MCVAIVTTSDAPSAALSEACVSPSAVAVMLAICVAVALSAPVSDSSAPVPTDASVVIFEMTIATTGVIAVPPSVAPLAEIVSVSVVVAVIVEVVGAGQARAVGKPGERVVVDDRDRDRRADPDVSFRRRLVDGRLGLRLGLVMRALVSVRSAPFAVTLAAPSRRALRRSRASTSDSAPATETSRAGAGLRGRGVAGLGRRQRLDRDGRGDERRAAAM